MGMLVRWAVLAAVVVGSAAWGPTGEAGRDRPATPGASPAPSPAATPVDDGLAATVEALRATVAAQEVELAALELRVAELEEPVGVLLAALIDQTAQAGFMQAQLDDLRARVEALEAPPATPAEDRASPQASAAPQRSGTPAPGR